MRGALPPCSAAPRRSRRPSTPSKRPSASNAPPSRRRIDGELSEEIWVRAPLVDDFHQVTPVECDAPSERTEVYVLYDRDALYIGVRLFDAEPELINARILRQGQNINSDDRFFVHIDPFNNRRSGYLFGVNPNGVRYDGIFEGVTQRQFDWDGIWQAAARITPEGWVLEIAIPFKTLSFDPSTTTWRMNFARNIERKNEGMAWISRNRNTDLSTMGDVTGISQIEQGRGLDVVPSMSVHDRRAIGTTPAESDAEPSLDVFYKITPQLNASLTLNTDFSATEVDDRQVNLSRFSLFFPERRDFFLQDADIFQFGRLQQDGRPFFSRSSASARPASPCRSTSAAKSAAASAGSTSARWPCGRRLTRTRSSRRHGRRDDGVRRPRRRQRARRVERRHDRDARRPDLEPRQQRGRRRFPLSEQPAHQRQVARGRRVVPAVRQREPRRRRHGVRLRRALPSNTGCAARSGTRASSRTSIRRWASCGARASTKRTSSSATRGGRGRAIRTIFSGLNCHAHRVPRRRLDAEPEHQPCRPSTSTSTRRTASASTSRTTRKACESRS